MEDARLDIKKQAEEIRKAVKRREIQATSRPFSNVDEAIEKVKAFEQILSEGTAEKLKNELLEIKRILDIDRKTNRLSASMSKVAELFIALSEALLPEMVQTEKLKQQLETYKDPDKREHVSSQEQIEIRKLVMILRRVLQSTQFKKSRINRAYETLCRGRYKELTEESSLLYSALEYLQYVEAPQRGKLETQMNQKMKGMVFEKRIVALKAFVANLINVSPSILHAEIQRLMEMAEEFISSQHIDSALEELRKALEYDDKSDRVYALMAECYARKEERIQQAECLSKAIENDPTNSRYLQQLGELSEAMGNKLRAIKIYRKLLELRPNRFSLLIHLARLTFEQKLWKESVPLLAKVLEKKPNSIKTLRRLGMALVESEQYKKGISILKEAIQREDTDGYVHVYLGRAYRALEFYKDALASFKNAASLHPEETEVRYWLAMGHYDRGDYEEAEAICLTLKSKSEKKIAVSVLLAKLWQETGKAEEAINLLRPLAEKTKQWDLLLELAKAELKEGKNEEAYSILKVLFSQFPDKEEVRHTFGLACVQSGHFEESLKCLAPAGG